jgi:hypothetical protein
MQVAGSLLGSSDDDAEVDLEDELDLAGGPGNPHEPRQVDVPPYVA